MGDFMDKATLEKEATQLKSIIVNGELTVPSFWDCVWPGLLMSAWMVICPFVAFEMTSEVYSDSLTAIAGGAFIGLIFTVFTFNIRSLYLAVPKKFTAESRFFSALQRKVRVYYIAYMLFVALSAYFATYSNVVTLFYFGPLIVSFVFIMVIGLMDVNRYRVPALSAVFQMLKARKSGGVSEL
ncbi:hypothetical protein (plasmid) [Serratia marcescens]|uniref:Conjugal transfer protein TraS n=2 Tax=Serratia TaxID=613 RepID=A0A9N7Q0I7_SERMA|nr:hypothetical protein [Serratia marcescens]BCG07356.1 hypothetical protein [Serratia marcescens]BCT02774.1 hypothetical protein [Serratia marcescens]BCT02866.1 hypothetical protein [Serratia marcescens]